METKNTSTTSKLNTALDLVYLASCAVRETVPDKDRIAAMDLPALYKLANRHMMTGIAAMALRSAGVTDDAFREAEGKAIRKVALFDFEREQIFEKLEEAGIWYLPLKGAVLKDLYPAIGMREMSDNDILVDDTRAEDVRGIMGELGYRKEETAPIHDSFYKAPVLNFEIHYRLFDSIQDRNIDQYYRNVCDRLFKDDNNQYRRHFSPDDFYIYLVTHEHKHYESRGTGLRSLMDIWVLLQKMGSVLDRNYIDKELEKLGILEFEKVNWNLSIHLFEEEVLTEEDRNMLEYVLSSGTYGTIQNKVDNGIRQFGGGITGKMRYLFSRVFVPMETVKAYYSLFAKVPVLLPFLPLYRLYRGLTNRGKKKKMQKELKAIRTTRSK